MNSISSYWSRLLIGVGTLLLAASVLQGQVPKRPGGSAEKRAPDMRVVEAAQAHDKEQVRSLIRQRANVNAAQGDGATALHWSVYLDDLEMTELLLSAGAKVNAANDYGVTSLALACANRNSVVVEKLLTAGANPNAARVTGETPLMTCSKTGDVKAVRALLSSGANVNAHENQSEQTALMWAIAGKHPDVVRLLIEHGADVRAPSKSGFTTLMFAAEQGDVESARLLLAAGAPINETTPQNGNALMVAVSNGHEALAKFLIEQGGETNIKDPNGVTPLHYAVLRGLSMSVGVQLQPFNYYMFRPNMVETVKALLAHGANPNARIVTAPVGLKHAHNTGQRSGLAEGATPFFIATFTADVEVMRALVAGGADPSIPNKAGVTPLMVASGLGRTRGGYEPWRWRQTGHPEVTDQAEAAKALAAVKYLVELGADVNAKNSFGETAVHGAAHDGADGLIQFLAEHGANLDAKDMYGQTALSIAQAIVPTGTVNIVLVTRLPHKSTAELLRKLGAAPVVASTIKAPPDQKLASE